MFKISTSEFVPGTCTDKCGACADEFLVTVTEGVVHGVYKVVTRLSFGVT